MDGRAAVLGWVTAVLALATPTLAQADVAFTSAPYPLPAADSEFHSRQGAVALVDLNNDARRDIVIYRGGHGKVFVLLNKGDGTFAPAQEYPGCANTDAGGTMVTGQFDAGQAADVILGCEAATGYNLLLGGGDGTLGAATPYSGIGLNNAIALWPSDTGGFPDLLYGQAAGLNYLCYRPVNDLASPQCPNDTSASDADGPSGHASIGPALATAHFYDNAACPQDDLIVSPYLNAVRVWGRNPFGTDTIPACASLAYTERAVQGIPAGENLEYIAATDISGDGHPDLVMGANGVRGGGQTTASSVVALIWQAGSATLEGGFPPGQQSVVTPSVEHVEDLQVADFDGDGNPDAAVVGESSGVTTATLAVHRGHGDGGFDNPPVTFSIPGGSPDGFNTIGPNHLAAGDVNGDGRPDIVSVPQDGDAVTVLLNGSVAPPSPPPPPVTPPGAVDTLSPVISGLTLTNHVFRLGRGPTAIAAAAPRGTTIRYRLSEAAKVTIGIARKAPGRRKGRRCVAPSSKLRHAKRCKRLVGEGRLVRANGPGTVSIAFSGRIGRRALAVGRHRMTLVAMDPAGNASKRSTLSLRIVRR